ncbi:MAG: phenylalanine--tRNA ligase subunit alpha [Candidatus Hodarchaeaceae archaeon]|nr:phenylalanine--tRNA ligase subunit alpha [Candidatus Hodarchaeaceae archaeon]
MDLRSLIDGLGINERKVLLALQQLSGEADIADIEGQTGLEHVAVMRAALNLEQRGLVRIKERRRSMAAITEEGRMYAKDGLPERRMLRALVELAPCTAEDAADRAGLPEEQLQISLGWLSRKGWAVFIKQAGRAMLAPTRAGEEALKEKRSDERLLEVLASGNVAEDELPEDLRLELDILKKRELAFVKEEVWRRLVLTELGERALALGIELVEEVSELTHELLASGRWREVRFRRYDVTAPGPPVYPGRVHPQQRVIDELREILLEMGFVEVKSNLVESEFWNFDALFQAQDHPAREIHDSLSLSRPERTKLPSSALVKRVAAAHERGVAGSTGWGYKFDIGISRRPVLCSQTTAATVRYLASHPKPPVKVLCIDRVYRHERIDYKHLAEFYQCEGIVMDRGLTLRDMLGYLKQIMVKLGFKKIRFMPSYFPYTEPSVQAQVYHEEKREWLEILGAGIFRPELLHPLGIRYPVLAWGIGLSRLIMARLGLEDIRDLFRNDLQWISSFVYTRGTRKESSS